MIFSTSAGSMKTCEDDCACSVFLDNIEEACFLMDSGGTLFGGNSALMQMLGYNRKSKELPSSAVRFVDGESGDRFLSAAREKGSSPLSRLILYKKDGSIALAMADLFVRRTEGQQECFAGIIRTLNQSGEIKDLEKEKEKLREERRDFFSNSMLMMNYMSDDLMHFVQDTGEDPLATAKRKATILFFDLRNSTGIAEQMDSATFASLLSDLYTDIMDLIYGNHGSVNKLLGDGILATFGCPVAVGNDAVNAVNTALQIQDYLNTFNDVRPEFLIEPIRAGIGIATGIVFTGVLGSVRRQEYAVLGDAVNIASRLEGYTKTAGCPILIEDITYADVKDSFTCSRVTQACLRGKEKKITIYAV